MDSDRSSTVCPLYVTHIVIGIQFKLKDGNSIDLFISKIIIDRKKDI